MYSTIRRSFYCDANRETALPKLQAAINGIKGYLAANHPEVTLDSDEVRDDDVAIGYETGDLDDG